MNQQSPLTGRVSRRILHQPRPLPFILITLLCFFAAALLLVACQAQTVEVTRIVAEFEAEPTQVVEVSGETVVQEVVVTASPGGAAGENGGPVASSDTNPAQQTQARLIIKDGDMTIEVRDADAAAEELINLTVDFGGYVIGQRIWTGSDGFRFADIEVAVPVNQFEAAMRAFRTLGIVLDESATGEDVTDEYVDLNSRLGNLYATQDRLRTFLEQATTISETLAVHNELTAIEQEIGVIQGRINFLQDRSSFSTITVNLQPLIPTPTSTPTATPTLPPTPEIWLPGDTAETAVVQLRNTGQSFFDFLLYNGIVCGPWLLALALLAYGGYRIFRRVERGRRPQ